MIPFNDNQTNNLTAPNEQEIITEVDQALARQSANDAAANEREQAATEKLQARATLVGRLLRYVGTAVLLVAALTSLFQQWNTLSDAGRYFAFLAYTAAMCAAGLLCGLKIKEDKGARTLLAVVAGVIPIHFAQLGALLYVGLGYYTAPQGAYDWTMWSAASSSSALTITGVAMVALAPMAFLAYSVLARAEAKRLTIFGFAASALLLVPTRDGVVISMMAGAAAVVLAGVNARLRQVPSLRTFEGRVARSSVFAPVVILLGRQAFLYTIPQLGVAIVFGLLALGIFQLPIILGKKQAALCELTSMIPATVACFVLSSEIIRSLGTGPSINLMIIGLMFSAMTSLMAANARATGSFFEKLSAVVAVGTTTCELFQYPSVPASMMSLIIGIVVTIVACVRERRVLLAAGLAGVASGLVYQIRYALDLYSLSPWMTLGSVGILTVVAASYLERNFGQLTEKYGSLRKELSSWN
jgi:hypothetical protein